MSRSMRLVFCCVLLAVSVPAQIVVDPAGGGNFRDLQTALNRSAAGSVFRVKGGTYRALKITKTATIIGDPAPTLTSDNWVQGKFGDQPPVIRLTGTGKEELTLVNVKIGGRSNWGWTLLGAGIDGVGFASVRIHRSTVRAMDWPSVVTGAADSVPGIRLRNANGSLRVLVADSHVSANNAVDGGINVQGNKLSGAPAIEAPSANVVVVGGVVRGGGGAERFFTLPTTGLNAVCPCPALGSFGGSGVVARTVWSTRGSIQSGAGGVIRFRGRRLGQQGQLAAIVATATHTIRDDGTRSKQPAVGQTWSVQFPNRQFVAVGLAMSLPVRLAGDWLFVDLRTATFYTTSVLTNQTVRIAVPNVATLAGLPVAAQAYDLLLNRLGTPLVEVVAF